MGFNFYEKVSSSLFHMAMHRKAWYMYNAMLNIFLS